MKIQCIGCGQTKDHTFEYFPSNRTAISGLSRRCRPCDRQQKKEWRENNVERMRELHRVGQRRRRANDPKLWAYTRAKSRAAKRGLEFTIAMEDLAWPTHCPVLGIPLRIMEAGSGHFDNSWSLDRIDNRLGYVPGNVEVISGRANRIKCDATPDELRRLADYYERMGQPH